MDARRIGLLRSLRSYLAYHRLIGIDRYPGNADSVQFGTVLKTTRLPVAAGIGGLQGETDTRDGSRTVSAGDACEQIAQEVQCCTGCELFKERLMPVPGHGGHRPKVLFVGEWLAEERERPIPRERIFGEEEDVMVMKMLAAMKLPSEQAFITNIIKCAIPRSVRPNDIHMTTCRSFLVRQISALVPEIICTMGTAATRAVLETNLPLSQLRGKIQTFALSETQTLPVVPTYHPTFLLKNPELKRATWADLQGIARLLKL